MTFRGQLAGLQVQLFDLSFSSVDDDPPGVLVGSASYLADSGGWASQPLIGYTLPVPPGYPGYSGTTTSGIVQQVDQVQQTFGTATYWVLESVAIAVITVTSPGTSGNFRVVVQSGGQPVGAIPYQYNRPLSAGALPDPATWTSANADGNVLSSWAALPVDCYVSVPATATPTLLQLPADGTPPPYGTLLSAVQQVVDTDPGTLAPVPTAPGPDAPAGATSLALTSVAGITVGMTAAGGTIPPGTTVAGVTDSTNTVALSQPLTGPVPAGTPVTFAVNLAALSVAQCQNIAYEIIWGQQPALPTPPDPVEDLYTNPPNNGVMLSGTTPNADESGRQQFEGTLQSYYTVADTTASRLTNFVFALSAAIACEQQSIAAPQAMLSVPVGAGLPGSSLSSQPSVILTGVAGEFAVPAAYFYALGAALPTQVTATQRYQQATGDQLARLLTDLTTAIQAGTVSDGEQCYADAAVTANAAQAARRVAALGVPTGSATPLAPLGSADLQALVNSWLSYPATPQGMPSSDAYQPADDAQNFWPAAAAAHPAAFLSLVLSVLTQGYVIPAPFNVALGTQITAYLATLPGAPSPPTVATLASVTTGQWADFFQQNPTWLPPFAQLGNTGARTAAFIAAAQNLFPVAASGPPSAIMLATSAPTTAGTPGASTLTFVSTTGVVARMTVAGPDASIQPGTTVLSRTATTVTLSTDVAATVPAKATITFTPGFQAAAPAGGGPPLLQAPSTDWLAACLASYGAFTFGDGFDLAQLQAAAASVFPGDQDAQAWLVAALTAIDALYQVVRPLGLTSAAMAFSVVEALYARGFRGPADITELDPAAFQQALTGTVAYDSAPAIYTALNPGGGAAPPPASGFTPVNPGGTLTDCIPAPTASPLGPVAYLHEMLTVTELSRCDDIAGTPPAGGTAPALGTVLSTRRGPVGDLTASPANLQTPLPLIDIVNECLESLGTAAVLGDAPAGAVHDTAGDTLAGLTLCADEPCPGHGGAEPCHEPARLFAALPQYSTPVPLTSAPGPSVFDKLPADFSSCLLPYSRALDVSRTYLERMGSCRFEEKRVFSRCVTEFVLDPAHEPAGFQAWLWRYPVRVDIAIEYLGISPEEYTTLFQGAAAPPCEGSRTTDDDAGAGAGAEAGAEAGARPAAVLDGTVTLAAFLAATCLTYCEFYELWQSGYVTFASGEADRDSDAGDGDSDAGDGDTGDGDRANGDGAFPQCEPCCLDDLRLVFPDGQQETDLQKLRVFVRLWRRLRDTCHCYSFAQLRDICEVLGLYLGGTLNPDFIRHLAAFQMLRDHFRLDLTDPGAPVPPGATGADRTQLLALWVGEAAATWPWAVRQLITGVEQHARREHECGPRPPEFLKLLAGNLGPLSRLAGFDPGTASDTWHAQPTHTLRFAEVLSKVYASRFTVGELIFLFTAGPHLDGDDPFPLPPDNEALDDPLALPDGDHEHALWRLRHDLLTARPADDEEQDWPWRRVEAALQSEFGFAAADVLSLGQHFFPGVLEQAGYQVPAAATRFVSQLDPGQTSAPTWNTPPDGPLHYDPSAGSPPGQLSARIPLTDEALIAKLTRVHELDPDEQRAVQDLFFQPRALLARFALLFGDFAAAQRALIEEPDEEERFGYFRHQFLLCRHRCHVIARHLSRHVAAVTRQEDAIREEDAARQEDRDGDADAGLILRALAADENMAVTGWEPPAGTVTPGAPPTLTWTPPPNGSALSALLGLAGTGLATEYRGADGDLAWRDVSGPLSGFGAARDRANCPLPTVLPGLAATLPPTQLQYVSVRNGFLMDDASGDWLGGAAGFAVTWSGALLVDRPGSYEFWAGGPTPGEERPDLAAAEHQRWRVELRQGQRRWVLLSHHWAGEEERGSASLPLRRGVYELRAELVRPAPEFGPEAAEAAEAQARPQRTGFEVKYSGPDSDERRVVIPHSRLFAVEKTAALGDGIQGLSAGAAAYLDGAYLSSLRDIRRTYQRAFKALLFTRRLALSARRQPHETSELGYLLSQPALFAGSGYYRAGGGFTRQPAYFDFDFLPVRDGYHAPGDDLRTDPSPQRVQAMFDWWERLFDYTAARAEVHRRTGRALWHLFAEAEEKHPADPGPLLRHLGADARHWPLDLRYFAAQASPVYQVTSADLADERWTLRAWHADRWLRTSQRCFAARDIAVARPDLWASDDPGAQVPGETEPGNANLLAFVTDGCADGEPRRYDELRRLNDGLRERGRAALVAYLCHHDSVPLPWRPGQFARNARDLSDFLLIDVEAGIRERASRIEEAISAAQAFIRRARLGLEPGWTVTPEFARLWDRRFATFHVWQACRRRELYQENWIEWDALDAARGVEAFRFLQDRLRDASLTIAVPGGLEWWPDQRPPAPGGLVPLQRAEESGLRRLAEPREGLSLLGPPEHAARPSWLAALGQAAPLKQRPTAEDDDTADAQGTGTGAAAPGDASLPYWLRTAIRLGTRFWRVAAAGVPPAGNGFAPHPHSGPEGCVTCCRDCGCGHGAPLDEYYFWLVDGTCYAPPPTPAPAGFAAAPGSYQDGYQEDFYDPVQQEAALWQDPDQLPTLLQWQGSPLVRLAWCRVRDGEFQQPRRSDFGVAVTPGQDADLVFLGRTADSLTFSVTGGAAPDGYLDPSAPGFRYDLAADAAVVLPRVAPPPPPPPPPVFLGSLPAYPYFVFFAPGTHVLPLSPFAPALAVACALRSRCRFEAALHWYRLAFDPWQRDCAWGEGKARDRAVLLHYLETLVEWGDAVRRGSDAPEAFQQARVIFDAAHEILGRRPRAVRLRPPATPTKVSDFVPEHAPLNPRLLDLYDTVDDRLSLIRADIGARRLTEDGPGRELRYFGGSPPRAGWRDEEDCRGAEGDWCLLPSPYRFTFLVAKAQEWAAKAEQLGGALLAAFDKGDAEFLAALRAGQELELLTLALQAKQDQWRDADWQVEALQAGKAVSQANLVYTNGLIHAGPGGLIDGEIQYQDLTGTGLSMRGTANVIEGVGEAMRLIPDLVLGAAGFGGSPVSIAWIPLGTKIGDALEAIARIMNNSAEIDSMTAGLDQTNAEWLRRFNEWIHQAQVLAIEIHQAELQILGAQRRRDQALVDLNSHRRQMEQSREVQDFLRDKFTAHDLYLFLQRETLALYRTTYELAQDAARQAQRAFNLERGYTARRFLPDWAWDDQREGLLAGERLSAALRRMEKAYLDENVREYELTKTFSLRLHFPAEFLRLRTTGRCEIEIPEWMFDLETPGMYLRQIKSVALTIPCVTGPYTGVHCRLTLLGSTTRTDPVLRPPAHECCCPREACCGDDGGAGRGADCGGADCDGAREYELCPDDPRAVRLYGARQAIATSSGQNDAGLFQLNFDDPRYLPFEFMGVVSRWRVELPPENNYFPLDTVTDVVLSVNYTAREGGDLLRRAASASARRHLPGDGWRFLDIRHEFPDAWARSRDRGDGDDSDEKEKRIRLELTRPMFPFVPGGREVRIDRIAVVFRAPETARCSCQDPGQCPCPRPSAVAAWDIGFDGGRDDARQHADVRCFTGQDGPGLYCGVFATRLGPLAGDRPEQVELRFPAGTGPLDQMFLLCRYRVEPAPDGCGR